MEGPAHLEGDDPARTSGTGQVGGGGNGVHRSADDHLPRGVEVGHHHRPLDGVAQLGHDDGVEADHRCHRPLRHRRHQTGALDDEPQGGLRLQGPGGGAGGELPDRMSGHGDHLDTLRQGRRQHHLREHQRRLGDLGSPQRCVVIASPGRREIDPGGDGDRAKAASQVGLVETGGHPHCLAPLTREAERDAKHGERANVRGEADRHLLGGDHLAAVVMPAVGAHAVRQARLLALGARVERGQLQRMVGTPRVTAAA
jgi:hypothetical protein